MGENNTIISLAHQFPQVSITVNASDLLEFGKALVKNAIEESAIEIRKSVEEECMTRKETKDFFGVTFTTIDRWRKRGYLVPTMVGGRPMYKRSDCLALLNKKERRYE